MQTHLAPFLRDTPEGREAEAILRKCVHCGFCTATCPTYQVLGDDLDSPRGRIYLMKRALEGAPVTERTRLHLDRCLTCRACETTCPSGVRYGRLVDIGRAVVESRTRRGPIRRVFVIAREHEGVGIEVRRVPGIERGQRLLEQAIRLRELAAQLAPRDALAIDPGAELAVRAAEMADLVREEHCWSRGDLVRLKHPELGEIVTQGIVPSLSRYSTSTPSTSIRCSLRLFSMRDGESGVVTLRTASATASAGMLGLRRARAAFSRSGRKAVAQLGRSAAGASGASSSPP